MYQSAYQKGVQAAMQKWAVDTHNILELAGLGLIAAPVAHSLIAGEEDESPPVTKLKHLSDLSGLGLLAGPVIHKMVTK